MARADGGREATDTARAASRTRAHCGRTSGYVYEHGLVPQLQRSASSAVDPKSIVDPSANVISRPLNARAVGSVAAQPEIVIRVPVRTFSLKSLTPRYWKALGGSPSNAQRRDRPSVVVPSTISTTCGLTSRNSTITPVTDTSFDAS